MVRKTDNVLLLFCTFTRCLHLNQFTNFAEVLSVYCVIMLKLDQFSHSTIVLIEKVHESIMEQLLQDILQVNVAQ